LRPHEAVVAGSPEFVDSLLPLLTERLGGAPRVADSPLLASALCQEGARLLVYEHSGREWLSLCAELRSAAGSELIVVVALPPEHAGDVAEISAAASAVVAWRGEARPVLEAANRVMAAREAPASPAPARRPGPVLTPQPSPAVGHPAPTPPPPPATPRPRPVMAVQGPQASRPPPAAAPAAAAVAARPTPAPARPSEGAAREAAFDAIFTEEAVAGAPTRPPAADPSPPPSPASSTVWPGTVLSADDGLSVVRAALSGLWPEQRLRPVTERLLAALSTAEKAAAQGHELPFDPAPVRRAVGIRWQVAAAIDTRPPLGAQVDQGAVQAILMGIDEVLAALKEQSDDAAPEALRAIETVRHALVKEAIDLTEALQQVAPAEVVEEITTTRKARRGGAAAVTRMVHTTSAADDGPSRVPWGLLVVLVLVMVAAGAYHGYRYVNRAKPPAASISGAPTGTLGSVNSQGKLLVTPGGAVVDPKELENYKNLERAKGNEVREILPGTFVVTPESARSGKAPDAGAGSKQGAKP
jgi:hypothetical protein